MPRCAVLGVWSATRRKGTVHAVNARLSGYARRQGAKHGVRLVRPAASRLGETCVCSSTAGTSKPGAHFCARPQEMLQTGHQGALRALIIGARGDHVRVTPHAPILPGSGDTASARSRRRRTRRRRRPQAGEDMDTTWRVTGPGLCLQIACGRTASAVARWAVPALLAAALGSCTGTVPAHPDAPAPQTP